MKIDVLGTEYTIERRDPYKDDCLYEVEADGYCDDSAKLICIADDDVHKPGRKSDMDYVRRKQVRHELVHAFLFESGLAECSQWAQNEEIVDWIAMQGQKLYKAWREAGALDDDGNRLRRGYVEVQE